LFRVSREVKGIAPVLSAELARYFLEIKSGLPRREALTNLAERNQVNALNAVVGILLQSSRLGTDISGALRVHSLSIRTERIQAAEEQGGQVSVKLVFPLVLLILPALLIVVLGPAMVNMFDRLGKFL
jgi:tight adherence protein C